MTKIIDSKIPEGPIAEKWTNYKAHQKLVNPANKRRLDIIVVGTGLAGASAAASLGEMGFRVFNFCIQDSPRRAHSIAAQGGINAAKNYQNDGDSVYRLFYDTVKGGDYRAREANVYRLAEVSNNIIDQCVAQGVPFAREYGGLLANRSFGGAQVSRTFYAKGQTGQQLLLGAYSALSRQVGEGTVKLYTRYEMEELVIVDGRARGIIAKNLVTGKLERFAAHAVVIATGGYGNAYFLSTNAMACNCTAAMSCYRKGAWFANPAYVQIHPTCIPVHGDKQSKLTLMSESLRNDGRIWVPKKLEDAKALQAGTKKGSDIPEEDRDYYLERRYPAFGNLVPRDVASRAAKERCDHGFGVNNTGLAVFLDFSESIERLGIDVVRQRYGNLFDMYEEITDVNPGKLANEINGVKYYNPMMIYPAIHYTMGGIWVDYELQTSIKGLFAIGECNFSDHGANRLGASALMQGLADGYFVLPYTIQNYLADQITVPRFSTDLPEFDEAEKAVQAKIDHLMGIKGKRSVDSIHKELGHIMWEYVGMGRTEAGLKTALTKLKEIRKTFETELFIPGSKEGMNVELDKAIRLNDFITMGELIAYDALNRNESCGGHFREEYQTEEGEAKRDDANYFYVSCWEYQGSDDKAPVLYKEPLVYEAIKVQTQELISEVKQLKNLSKMDKNISFTLKVWRQNGPKEKGHFDTFQMKDIPGDTSFLEMLDILNEQLIEEGKEPIVFDHDCREGICGMCSLYINGHPHGPATGATTCQIYMRRFKDGDVITVEPWRSAGFPVIKDLMVDRSAYDKIMQAGGFISIRTGAPQDANAILIPKPVADEAMDAASCIGCGACVAACKNGSAMLFVSAKVSQLNLLPQGKPEALRRAKAMLSKMDELGFGNCTNTRACEAECPKCVSISNIARLNRDFIKAKLKD